MKKNKTNLKQTSKQTELKGLAQGSKYLLPKLKSYSQNNVQTYANLHLKTSPNSHYPFTLERKPNNDTTTYKTELSKLSLIKYQYVSKSPAYFKRQQRSINSVRFNDHTYHQPVESYVESKMKEFNKQALIDLVNSRVKTLTNSNSKFTTIQQPNLGQNSINSQLTKSKINYEKLNRARSSHKLSQLETSSRLAVKPFTSIDSEQKKISRSGNKSKNTLIQKDLSQIEQKTQTTQKEVNKLNRKYSTLQHKNVEFYQTKYSHFEPNKIENVKNHIQNIKKYPSLKLNLYNLY